MNGEFNDYFNSLAENAILVKGQTDKSLCLKLLQDQLPIINGLVPEEKTEVFEWIGEIGLFLLDTPFIYNELAEKVKKELGITPGQLKDLIKRARRKRQTGKGKNIPSGYAEPPRNTNQQSQGKCQNKESQLSAALQVELFQISQTRDDAERKSSRTADKVLEYLMKTGQLYRHKEIRDFENCLYFNNTQKRLLALTGDEFRSWLSNFTGINMSLSMYTYVFDSIQVEALSGDKTPEIIPERFWCAREKAIYMSNGDGRIVKIIPDKATIEDNGVDDVLFACGYTLAPWDLTTPEDPFQSCRVFKNMKLVNPCGLDLLRAWCVSLPANQQTKPPIVLTGPVGGGKTKTACGIFELFGIFPRITKPLEDGEPDFWTSMDAGGLFCLDNADTKIKWLPDALAAAATGGKHEKRKLYTDSGLVRQGANSALIITSANPAFASDAGLADRLLVVRLDRRDDTEDTSLSKEVLEKRDAGLSWIAYTLSKALADNTSVEKGLNKRHPDFAVLAVKIGRAVGREREIIDALLNAETDKSLFNIENDDIGNAVFNLINEKGEFRGTAAELFTTLQSADPTLLKFSNVKRLSKHLMAIWPHLSQIFEAESHPGHGGINQYAIRKRGGFGGFEGGVSQESASEPYGKSPGKTALKPTKPTIGGGAADQDESEMEEVII